MGSLLTSESGSVCTMCLIIIDLWLTIQPGLGLSWPRLFAVQNRASAETEKKSTVLALQTAKPEPAPRATQPNSKSVVSLRLQYQRAFAETNHPDPKVHKSQSFRKTIWPTKHACTPRDPRDLCCPGAPAPSSHNDRMTSTYPTAPPSVCPSEPLRRLDSGA